MKQEATNKDVVPKASIKSTTRKTTSKSNQESPQTKPKPNAKTITKKDNTIQEAVILLNMGGPNNLFEVEMFLKNMFNDPNILSIKSDFLRNFVGRMIANKRIEEAKKNYMAIGGKSPIVELTYKLIKKLSTLDKTRFYTYAMRYTPPFAPPVIEEIKQKGIKNITLFSMYPQYSKSTTKSSIDDAINAINSLKDKNFKPKIKVIENYPTNISYNKAIAKKIKSTLAEINLKPKDAKDFILFLSAHSLPQSMIDKGDPYQKECESNTEILKTILKDEKIQFKKIINTYQSKLGPIKWLGPSTKSMIEKYKDENILIYPLAFTIDNSETKYELDIEYAKDLAQEIGAKNIVVCECLNDDSNYAKSIIEMLEDIK